MTVNRQTDYLPRVGTGQFDHNNIRRQLKKQTRRAGRQMGRRRARSTRRAGGGEEGKETRVGHARRSIERLKRDWNAGNADDEICFRLFLGFDGEVVKMKILSF